MGEGWVVVVVIGSYSPLNILGLEAIKEGMHPPFNP